MNRIKHHVKKGDQVEVISGNYRGSTGKILSVMSKKNRVLIEGVRLIKKTPAQIAGQSVRARSRNAKARSTSRT